MAKLTKILNIKDRVEPPKMTAAQIAKAKAIKAAGLAASRKPAPPMKINTVSAQEIYKKTGMKPPKDDSKLLSKLPVTQSHLNTIKKHYGI